MINCHHCGAETSNGLALCELCQQYARTCLSVLPTYFANLARWKPGRAGSRLVPGSRVLYEGPTGNGADRVSNALDEASNALSTWARALIDDRPCGHPRPLTWADAVMLREAGDLTEAEQATGLCAALYDHLTSIATLDWCGEFVGELARHEERLRTLTEQVAPGWYAGECRGCSTPTHVVPGLTWVTCSGCGRTTYARDHLPVIIYELSDWIAQPKPLAQTIVALMDEHESVEDLRKRIAIWGARGHLEVHRAADHLPKQYRFGDVLAMLARREVAA